MVLKTKETENGRMLSAKELHKYMEISRAFNLWIQGKIDKHFYENEKDYLEVWIRNETGEVVEYEADAEAMASNGYNKDYYLTLAMAKELCVLENTKQSRKIRKYLLICEENYIKFLKAKLYLLNEGKIDEEKLEAWQELFDFIKEFEPTVVSFRKQLLELIDRSFMLMDDMQKSSKGLYGIDGEF